MCSGLTELIANTVNPATLYRMEWPLAVAFSDKYYMRPSGESSLTICYIYISLLMDGVRDISNHVLEEMMWRQSKFRASILNCLAMVAGALLWRPC